MCFCLLLMFFINISVFSNNIDSLKHLLEKTQRDTALFDKYVKAAFAYTTVNPSAAADYCRFGLQRAKQFNYKKGEADQLNVIGVCFLYQGQYDSSLFYFNNSLTIKEKLNSPRSEALTINNLGITYHYKGEYEKALTFYLKALKINEEAKDTSGISMGYNNVAMIYEQQKRYDDALKYYRLALNISEQLKNEPRIAYGHVNCGAVFKYQNKFKESEKEFLLAMPILEKNKDNKYLSLVYNNLGCIYLEGFNDPKKALPYFNKAYAIRESISDQQGLSETLENLGNTYLTLSDLDKSIDASTRSYHLGLKTGYLVSVRGASYLLAKANEKKGDYKQAYKWFEEYSKYKDSLFNEDNSRLMSEMESKYESEKKQLEIENLQNKQALSDAELKNKEIALKRENIIKMAFAIGFGLMIVLAFFIYKSYRQKHKANKIITAQKFEVEHQKNIVEEKNKEITDSINYAKRLQHAILPTITDVKKYLPESFILYKPKDIVAGDFYWMHVLNTTDSDLVFIAAADSTGHGVPGAMVSVVCSNALNRAVNEFGLIDTGKILDKATVLVVETFAKSGEDVKDGMDISLLRLEFKNDNHTTIKAQWSGANNPLWYCEQVLGSEGGITQNNAQPTVIMRETDPDKQPVGKSDTTKTFSTKNFEVQKGNTIYLFTDGFADQFGGEKGKKYKYKQFLEKLLAINLFSAEEQRKALDFEFEAWRGNLEQVDDICIIGIKI